MEGGKKQRQTGGEGTERGTSGGAVSADTGNGSPVTQNDFNEEKEWGKLQTRSSEE